jgi:hypothetical protein
MCHDSEKIATGQCDLEGSPPGATQPIRSPSRRLIHDTTFSGRRPGSVGGLLRPA